ncbi:MAG: hydrogenase small subunit [Peptococcaceae bacterium]|jgi:hydrogenase small subunit|nr:hydrogenase small subunit [Peptococcaceae bacterium]
MGKFNVLNAKGVSRRDFMKLMAVTTAAFGLPATVAPQAAKAVGEALEKPPVIWLSGMECTGCTTSTISTIKPSAADLILDKLSIRYHEVIMAGTGDVAEEAYAETLKEAAGKYILIVEGSVPPDASKDDYCIVAGKPFRETVLEAAAQAKAVVAVGSCACDGAGIPGASEITQAIGVRDLLKNNGIATPVINLPCCPVKSQTVIGTLTYFLTYGEVPPLDSQGRPLAYYGMLLHDNCPRRGRFENGEFLKDWNDPAQKDYCLLLKGCKGPKTYTDCASVWFNDNANFCLNAGSPCSGCSETGFYAKFNPLYVKNDDFHVPGVVGQVSPDLIGAGVGVVAAGYLAFSTVGNIARGRIGKKSKEHGGDK